MSSSDAPPLPDCWSNDVRMNALFAPCKHKSIAPDSWRMKYTFWSEQLLNWCRHKKSPLVSVNMARNAYKRNLDRPACLDSIMDELVRSGKYVPAAKYTSALTGSPEGWLRWGVRQAFRPAGFTLGLVGSYLHSRVPNDGMATSAVNPDDVYVAEEIVKEQATELLRNYPKGLDRVGTLEEMMEHAGYEPAEAETFKVLLGYLITIGLATKKGDIFKLAEPGTSKVSPITECDESLHQLLAAERRLVEDSDRFEEEAEQALADTRAALRVGNKPQAKAHLRRKHRVNERAAKSAEALENIRQLIFQLRQADVNSTVYNTYKMSAGAMKRAMQEGSMDEDSVHQTMDDLKDVLESYSEVERTLAGGAEEYDAAELEDELEVLMASGPGDSAGGSPRDSRERRADKEARSKPSRPEKDFIYDGEERMMAELNNLSITDKTPSKADKLPDNANKQANKTGERNKETVAVAEWDTSAVAAKPKPPPTRQQPAAPSKAWYPPAARTLQDTQDWKLDKIDNLERMGAKYGLEPVYNNMEVRSDPRLHPGQKLDPRSPRSGGPVLYNTDFQVQDHKIEDGVFLFNSSDDNLKLNSTDYPDGGGDPSQGVGGGFEAAPGGQRRHGNEWTDPDEPTLEDLERRLRELRSFK